MRRQLSLGKNIVISFVFLLISFISLLTIILSNSLLTKASSLDPDLNVNVGSAVSLLLTNCDGSNSSLLKLSIEPTPTGTFKSACQETSVHTNTPGYSLTARASSYELLYLNPTSLDPTPIIDSSWVPYTSPQALTNDTWGFAVENSTTFPNFDTTYTINNPDNRYAQLPNRDITIYSTTTWPLPVTEHKFFYAARLTPATTAGTYGATITYTAIGEAPTPAPKNCKNLNNECILFTVDTTADGTYSIPTSGSLMSYATAKSYNWDVYVDGYLTTDCVNGNCTGVSGYNLPNAAGITLTNLSNNQHQILIVPHEDPAPGWGNAFGHYNNTTAGTANVATNKQKLISLDAPLTTMAFAPKTTESTTNASYMFAYTFYGCSNLTTGATILDTYKLPSTITNLSNFLSYTHSGNSQLTTPINLSSLSTWFNSNTSITNLSSFLNSTHYSNSLLTTPIDLSPLSTWFNSNTRITNLSNFLSYTHSGNSQLTTPINLSSLSTWFNSNTSITNLSSFLNSTHYGNSLLTTPIDLSSLSTWFNSNNSITNLSSFLYLTHNGNSQLTTPINLSPLSTWFNFNNSITDLSNFLTYTHSGNSKLTTPVDLSPLSSWFAAGRSMATLTSFMNQTHIYNTSLNLTGQTILPNWVKTMTDGSGTPLYNTGSSTTSYSFYRTFYTSSAKAGDTGEVKFQDGAVLSSLGTPSVNRQTYTNRSGITPATNWK